MNIGNKIRKQVHGQVFDQANIQVGDQIWYQVNIQVYNRIWRQIYNQTWDQVWTPGLRQVKEIWSQTRNQLEDDFS